ncbi:MAG: hypothetical protein RL250_298 [Verrucomicrobiota bacterium]|jgi:hypothetical protein
MRPLLALLLAPLALLADGRKFTVDYPISSLPSGFVFATTYNLWIPEGIKTVRGIIVHQHGCGEGSNKAAVTAADDLHWQALARKWDCALLGPVIRQPEAANCRLWCDPRNGSEQVFLRALADLARQSGHPEVATAPWCLWGHSGGGFWSSILQAKYPERIVAIWFRSGTAYSAWQRSDDPKLVGQVPFVDLPPAAYEIPMMANPGAKENGDKRFNGAWTGTLAMFKAYRAKGAPIGFAPDPLTSHQCGDQRYAAIAFFDACLALRLPEAGTTAPLRRIDQSKAWLAPLLGDTAVPAAEFKGDKTASNWLPDATFAKAWTEYVKTGSTNDTTPPPAPFNVAAQAVAGGVEITWDAHADLESGLRHFIVKRDGQTVGLTIGPKNPFGRALFQGMSYGDTPAQPLSAMRFLDKDGRPGAKYEVIAVNGAGLESK